MIDLEMMAALLAALPEHARLMLLGDKDQLASVEAGAVLGQLCAARRRRRLPPRHPELAGRASPERRSAPSSSTPPARPLDQAVAMLRHSYRFGGESGIGQLAAAVNAGAVDGVRRALAHGHADLTRLVLTERARARCGAS